MAKLINQTKDLSGQESKFYIFNGAPIEIYSFFLYEVSIHKYWKGGYCFLGSKLFKSDKLLKLRKSRIKKDFNGYFIEKELTLIGAPYDFIQENNLQLYKSKNKKKK